MMDIFVPISFPKLTRFEPIFRKRDSTKDTSFTSVPEWRAHVSAIAAKNTYYTSPSILWYNLPFVPHGEDLFASQERAHHQRNRALFNKQVRLLSKFSDKLGYYLVDAATSAGTSM